MVCAKQITCETALLLPPWRELSLSKQGEWLKPALQPQLLTWSWCKIVNLVQAGYNELITQKPLSRTTAFRVPSHCLAPYAELHTATPQGFLLGTKFSSLYDRSSICTMQSRIIWILGKLDKDFTEMKCTTKTEASLQVKTNWGKSIILFHEETWAGSDGWKERKRRIIY